MAGLRCSCLGVYRLLVDGSISLVYSINKQLLGSFGVGSLCLRVCHGWIVWNDIFVFRGLGLL
jgi:hypothetical protein